MIFSLRKHKHLNMKTKTSKNKKSTTIQTGKSVDFGAPVRRFWCVMKAHGWNNVSVAGIAMQSPPNGPQHFIPVFDTREQAVAWAQTEEHVYALESVA